MDGSESRSIPISSSSVTVFTSFNWVYKTTGYICILQGCRHFLTASKSLQPNVQTLIQNFGSCNPMSKNSDLLFCPYYCILHFLNCKDHLCSPCIQSSKYINSLFHMKGFKFFPCKPLQCPISVSLFPYP
jgi:hypothetical protein